MRSPYGWDAMADAELQLRGVVKRFGTTTVLDGLDLDVPAGCLMAVLGSSGSGKTTLLRIVAGFERISTGEVRIGGALVSGERRHLPPERRRIGIVPQEGALFPHLSVAANIGFGLPRAARRSGRVEDLLELVGLVGLGTRRPHELSGGQQQRVALARALAPMPNLVLLDEPFAALDAGLRAELRADVRRVLHAAGATAVLVTHDQEEALGLADQVAVLRAGKVVQVTDPVTLYSAPMDAALARFVGDALLLPGEAKGGAVQCAVGCLPLLGRCEAVVGPCTVMVRPEQIHLDVREGWPARVLEVTYYGHDALVTLVPEGPQGAAGTLAARVSGQMAPRVGDCPRCGVTGPVMAWPESDPHS